MQHLGTKTLETERLVLRRFRVEDAQAMFDNWAGDPQVTTYLSWPTHLSPDDSAAILSDWVEAYERDSQYLWAITLRSLGDVPIGSISAVRLDERTETAEIGYCIGRRWWRQGITSEALAALISFFFDEVGLNRVEARHDPRNENSGRVMMKCGMRYEGLKREADRHNKGIADAALYAILKRDVTKQL